MYLCTYSYYEETEAQRGQGNLPQITQLGSRDTRRCMEGDVYDQMFTCASTQSAWDWWRVGTTNDPTTFHTASLATGLGT